MMRRRGVLFPPLFYSDKEKTKMEAIWQEMRDAAMKVIRPRKVSGMVEVGGIAAAVESAS